MKWNEMKWNEMKWNEIKADQADKAYQIKCTTLCALEHLSWFPEPSKWSQFGSLGYTIMGKTADLTVVQKTIMDTLHKEDKPQTFIAKEAGCLQSAVYKHVHRKLSGRKKCGRKRCTTNREYEDCQAKSIQEFGWTSQGMDWDWGQGIKSHHTQTCQGIWLQFKSNQIKSILLSHHHSTCALVSEIFESVLQTVQKQFTYRQYILTDLYRWPCAEYTYIYSVHTVYY